MAESREDLVTELARLPERLEALLAGRREEELRRRPAPDAWSAKEIACHLRDAARIYHERLFLAATHERPFLPAFDEARLAREADYQQRASCQRPAPGGRKRSPCWRDCRWRAGSVRRCMRSWER